MQDSMTAIVKMEPETGKTEAKTEQIDNEESETNTLSSINSDVKVKSEDKLKQEPVDTEMPSETEPIREENTVIKEENDVKNEPADIIKIESENSVIDNDNVVNKQVKYPVQLGKPKRKRKRPFIRTRTKRRKFAEPSKNLTADNAESEAIEKDNLCGPQGDDVEYCLTVTNFPNNWSFMDTKNYIDTECGPVDEIEMLKDDKTGKGAIRLSYQTKEECEEAMNKLRNKRLDGTQLVLEMSVVSLESVESTQESPQPEPAPAPLPPPPPSSANAWRPDMDEWEIDAEGLYGLKPSFLKSLDITPPLDKWVYVSNFRCDKTELKEIVDMAGNVLMCSVFNASPKYANVMYSHPLEAVQAVSMLNGQLFYGQALKVAMYRSPVNTILLPKGLANIGQGLGAFGKPLRNITKHYHRFVTNQSSSINKEAFEMPADGEKRTNNEQPVTYEVKSVEDFNRTLPGTKPPDKSTATSSATTPTLTESTANKPSAKPAPKPNPPQPIKPLIPSQNNQQNFQQRNNFGTRPFGNARPGWNGPMPMPRPMQGPPRPAPGPMGGPPRPAPGPMGGPPRPMGGPPRPMPGPMGCPPRNMPGPIGFPPRNMPGPMGGPPRSMPGPMVGPPRPMPGPNQPMGHWANEPVQLQLMNLPPSTTFPVLCEKMAACGQVVSIQLTTPGCAVVTFANRMLADRCFQLYNGMCIEGNVMQVKYT